MHRLFLKIFVLTFTLLLVNVALGITSSVQTGLWKKATTWNTGGPICGDTIYISSNDIVYVSVHVNFSSCPTPMFLVIEGTLQFINGKKLKLPCGSGVLVKQGGSILGGGGQGNSDFIEICGTEVWTAGDGDVVTPTYFGELYSEKIISVTSAPWELSSTWDCNCDPNFYHEVIVDTPHTVSITNNTEINKMQIYGTLDGSGSSSNISLNGNWTNNGVFNSGSTTVILKGNNTQQLVGVNPFNNLTLANLNGAVISSGNVNLKGILTLTAGNFATSNQLIIISNSLGTGSIAPITTGSITGNITMQRYVDAGATDWRFITSPISGGTLADMNDDFVTSGFPGSQFPNWPTISNPWASIYAYDESQPGIQDSGFIAATNITNPMTTGKGFWVYSGDTIIGTQPFTIDFTGPANVGDIFLPVSYTNSGFPADDGWSMVGNPYPSTLDWDSPNIAKTNINNAIYIWNPDLQQFASYVSGIGTNGGSRNIASSQAFWVQANSDGAAVLVTETSKAATDGAFLKQNSIAPLRIKAQNNFGTDELAINFELNASSDYDGYYDARKMASVNTNLPSVSSVIAGEDYSINQLDPQEIDIPVKILTGVSGLHNISIENAAFFNDASYLVLEDLFTNTSYNLHNINSFTAYIYDTTTSARFLLHTGVLPLDVNEITNNEDKEPNVWISENKLKIELGDELYDNIQVRNLLGQTLFNATPKSNIISYKLDQLSSQILLVSFLKKNQLTTIKVSYSKN